MCERSILGMLPLEAVNVACELALTDKVVSADYILNTRFRSFCRRCISKSAKSGGLLILKGWSGLQSTQISPRKMFG